MSATEIRFSDLIDLVDCPTCQATVRQQCRTSTGHVAIQDHSARIRLASQALARLCGDRQTVRRAS